MGSPPEEKFVVESFSSTCDDIGVELVPRWWLDSEDEKKVDNEGE